MYYGNELSLFQKMIRRKPLNTDKANISLHKIDNDAGADNTELQRVLGPFDVIAFGIAIAVGSGIFVIAGEAGKYSGAGLFLSFIIIILWTMLCRIFHKNTCIDLVQHIHMHIAASVKLSVF
eukprot:419416_1